MKAEQQSNDLSFFSEEARGPQVDGPSRFARTLKQARFARGWTQAELAGQLSIPKRAITSWETAERIPSVGMVILLLDVLASGDELPLNQELLGAYIVDDLERQAQRRNEGSPFSRRVQRVIRRMLQLPAGSPASAAQVAEERASSGFEEQPRTSPPQPPQEGDLEPLFALMTQLHQHPELIPVARDFIRELTPDE